MNHQIESDEQLRTAVHDAVGPVTAGFDLMDRVRGGARRRRRRMRAGGSALAVVALAAGISLASQWHGGFAENSAAGVAVPDCATATAPQLLMAINTPGDGSNLVPGTPVVAVACAVRTDRGSVPSAVPVSTLQGQQLLRGDQLRQIVATLNKAAPGNASVNPSVPQQSVTVTILFRYKSHRDVTVTIPLYDNRAMIMAGPSGKDAHYWPKPIPDVIKALGLEK